MEISLAINQRNLCLSLARICLLACVPIMQIQSNAEDGLKSSERAIVHNPLV